MKRKARTSVVGGLVLTGSAIAVSIAWAAGALSTTDNPATPTPVVYTSKGGWTPAIASGGTAADIVGAVVRNAGLANTMQVSLSAKPEIPGEPSGQWLDFRVPTTGTLASNAYASWTADLVQGVIADAFAAHGLPPIAGSTFTGVLPGGTTSDIGGGMGDIEPGQSYSTDADATIKQRIATLLPRWDLTPVSVSVLRAGQPAPAVTVTTSSPTKAALAASTIVRALFGQSPPLYEGYYFQVDDSRGKAIVIAAAAFRDGSGESWSDPSVMASSSLIHG